MGEEKKYILDGYRFNDSDSYEQARRELNKVAELKSEKNLKDETELREVYDSLVESEEFITPVGIGFLREAQKRLVRNSEQRKTMKAIPYLGNINEGIEEKEDMPDKIMLKDVSSYNLTAEEEKAENEGNLILINNFKLKLRNYKIIIAFMAVMSFVPFGVLAYDKVFSDDAYEKGIIDKYASWKEELTKKERELNEREKIFEGMADKKLDLNSKTENGGEENGKSQNSGS